MKNKEKYAEQIVDIVCEDVSFGVDKRTGSLVSCRELHCAKCLFNEMNRHACYDSRKEWADSEYVELPVISKSDRTFLDYIRDEDKYIARDENGKLFTYMSKPCKIESFGHWTDANYDGLYLKCNVDFPMIKWGDDEPWLIEDLKKLEVVDEY